MHQGLDVARITTALPDTILTILVSAPALLHNIQTMGHLSKVNEYIIHVYTSTIRNSRVIHDSRSLMHHRFRRRRSLTFIRLRHNGPGAARLRVSCSRCTKMHIRYQPSRVTRGPRVGYFLATRHASLTGGCLFSRGGTLPSRIGSKFAVFGRCGVPFRALMSTSKLWRLIFMHSGWIMAISVAAMACGSRIFGMSRTYEVAVARVAVVTLQAGLVPYMPVQYTCCFFSYPSVFGCQSKRSIRRMIPSLLLATGCSVCDSGTFLRSNVLSSSRTIFVRWMSLYPNVRSRKNG